VTEKNRRCADASGAEIASWARIILESKMDSLGLGLITKAAACIEGSGVQNVESTFAGQKASGIEVVNTEERPLTDEPTITMLTEKEANLILTSMQIAGWFVDMLAHGEAKLHKDGVEIKRKPIEAA
jgi:hypothetical protein